MSCNSSGSSSISDSIRPYSRACRSLYSLNRRIANHAMPGFDHNSLKTFPNDDFVIVLPVDFGETNNVRVQKHVDNMWVLGGEFIRDLHNDPSLRKKPMDRPLSQMIEYGGPLLYHGGEGCGPHTGQIAVNVIEQNAKLGLMSGGVMPKMVIEVPEEFTEVGKAMAEHLAALQRTVSRLGGGKAVDYAEIEQAMAESAGRTELAGHRAILQSLDIDVPAVMIGGLRYTRVGRCEAPYHTMAGSVSVERSLYRQSGQRGGQPGGRVVDAVSLRAGVVEDGWLPRAARAMAHAVQQGPSREAEASAREFGRLPYSRASFERVAHLVGALAVADHQDIEDALIDAVEVPEEAGSISVSLDRVSVPMEEPRRRPAGRPKKGAAKRPVERNFRMAYCGTVTLHDENGVGRHTIRYGCMPDGDVIGLRDRLVADAATLRSKRPDLKLELLCDGAPEMWNLLEEGFLPRFGNDLHRLVDLHHLMEKLGAAARVIDHSTATGERLKRWKMSLLNRASGATDILEELTASGMDEGTGTDHPVHAAITYIQSHSADRMNYARARRLGLALGSGNVEATCKSLFETRMKRCGARWKEETGQHIVQLRALAISDRWGPAIALTLRPLRQSVRAA
jgi:hypothetical protein